MAVHLRMRKRGLGNPNSTAALAQLDARTRLSRGVPSRAAREAALRAVIALGKAGAEAVRAREQEVARLVEEAGGLASHPVVGQKIRETLQKWTR